MALDYTEHVFGPGETIHAIIRKYNHMSMTVKMLDQLSHKYNVLNNYSTPRPGDRVKIPLFIGFAAMPQTEKSYSNG